MFKSWLFLIASIFALSSCDSPTIPIGEFSIGSENNSLVGDIEGSVDLSYLTDGPEEFQFVPELQLCDLMSISPSSEFDYKLEIVEPDDSVDYTLRIVNPGDSWCKADIDSEFQFNIEPPGN